MNFLMTRLTFIQVVDLLMKWLPSQVKSDEMMVKGLFFNELA